MNEYEQKVNNIIRECMADMRKFRKISRMYEILTILHDVGKAKFIHFKKVLGGWIQYTLTDLECYELIDQDEDGFYRITELGKYYIHFVPKKILYFVNFERIRKAKETINEIKSYHGWTRKCSFCGRYDENYLEFKVGKKDYIVCRKCLLSLKSVKKIMG